MKTSDEESTGDLDHVGEKQLNCRIPREDAAWLLAHAREQGFRTVATWLRAHLLQHRKQVESIGP